MTSEELNKLLRELKLSQAEFAGLINTSIRTVNLWATGQRLISGPATAYLELLYEVPRAFLESELKRMQGDTDMPEGMYLVEYGANAGTGAGMLVLEKGSIYGIDTEMGKYDGEYGPSKLAGHTHLKIRVTIPAGTALVQGVPAQPADYAFFIESDVKTTKETSFVQVTPFGDVQVKMKRLRDIPKR
jgi:transcriptional regulator with XRE-family HTH domain